MSSNVSPEVQPLLDSMGKGVNFDHKDHPVTDVHIHIENGTETSRFNGLNRRTEKNGDAHGSLHNSYVVDTGNESIPHFPPEKWKTFLSFVFLAFTMSLNITVLAIVHERMPDRARTRPLPDVFFDVFPPIDWALDISEFIIIVSLWLTVLIIIMHKHRFIILRRCFVIIGILYFMRSITMFVTQVPVASTTYYCSPKANTTSPFLIFKRVLSMMSGFGLSINGKHTFCGDYIYSGHTVVLTMTYLVISEYTPKSSRKFILFHWIVWLASCTGIFMVLLSRGHYTIDVILGYYVSTRVFWMYHTMANYAVLKEPRKENFLSRIWWFSIFGYFERNVGGPLPVESSQFEWPLPWPRKFSQHTRIS